MQNNENNSEEDGKILPEGTEKTVAEVDTEYEANILRAVAESSVQISPEAQKRQERISLAESLEGRVFKFPGINDTYSPAERDECPMFTSWEELHGRFISQGMKVVFGRTPPTGEIFIVPRESTDIDNDSLMPRNLQITEDMDEDLKRLILLNQK